MKNGQSNGTVGPKSLREVVQQVDNQKDFNDYVLSHLSNPGVMCSAEVKYERHPVGLENSISSFYTRFLPGPDSGTTSCVSACSDIAAKHAK